MLEVRKFCAISEGFTLKNLQTPSRKYAFFIKSTQILRKIRKIYAKFTEKTQNLRKFCATTEGMTAKKMKNLAWSTHILRKLRKIYANLRKTFLRSYTKILSGQPFGVGIMLHTFKKLMRETETRA